MDPLKPKRTLSRRDFGLLSAAALAVPIVGGNSQDSPTPGTAAGPQVMRRPARDASQPLNIVFIFGDQERYFPKCPPGLSLPGHEQLQRNGVTFENHYTSAIMCTPSRA